MEKPGVVKGRNGKPFVLVCSTHGQSPWRGTIRCGHCKRAYRTDAGAPDMAPDKCACGQPSWFYPVCWQCYNDDKESAT